MFIFVSVLRRVFFEPPQLPLKMLVLGFRLQVALGQVERGGPLAAAEVDFGQRVAIVRLVGLDLNGAGGVRECVVQTAAAAGQEPGPAPIGR